LYPEENTTIITVKINPAKPYELANKNLTHKTDITENSII